MLARTSIYPQEIQSSSLKLIGREAFSGSGLREIHIPDRIEKVIRNAVPPHVWIAKSWSCRESDYLNSFFLWTVGDYILQPFLHVGARRDPLRLKQNSIENRKKQKNDLIETSRPALELSGKTFLVVAWPTHNDGRTTLHHCLNLVGVFFIPPHVPT